MSLMDYVTSIMKKRHEQRKAFQIFTLQKKFWKSNYCIV